MLISFKCFLRNIFIFKCLSYVLSHSDNQFNQNSFQPYPENAIESISAPKPGWVDPFDMLGESRSRDSLIVQTDVEIHMLQKRCSVSEIYLKRFVNQFLNAMGLRDGQVLNSDMKMIQLEFLIAGSDINILKDFGQSDKNDVKIESVSNVFDNIFSQKIPQDRYDFCLSNFAMWLQKAFLKVTSSPEWTVLSSVFLLLFMTLWFVYKSHSYRLALFTVLLTIFLAGFGFTWIRMYEEKEVERYVNIEIHGSIPRHCSRESQKMAWYEHMYYRMFGVDCYEFMKSRDIRPIVRVSPTDVLAQTFSSMVINPATNIGKAYGNFISNVMGSLPWWLKPLALPLSLIIPVLFVTILLAFMLNYRLSLSITGFHLIPSWGNTPQCEMRKSSQYVEDFPRKEESSQSNSAFNSILDSNTPLFFMNWKGLKKLSSSNLLVEGNEKNLKEERDQPLEEENEIMLEDLKKFVESLEDQKVVEERKKISIHTSAEGESSLSNRRSVVETPQMVEYSELPSGNENRTLMNTSKEKDLKDKTL